MTSEKKFDPPPGYLPIPGFSGYAASPGGVIFSRYSGAPRKPQVVPTGHHKISMERDDGATVGMYIHRLVAITFIRNPENKSQVNHKNGIPDDNRVENLEWVTHAENVRHAFRTGLKIPLRAEKHWKAVLTWDDVDDIRAMHASGVPRKLIQAKYSQVSTDHVNNVILRLSWKETHRPKKAV